MYLLDGFLIVICIQSLVVGFKRGLSPVILRLFKYVTSLLFITFLLPSFVHRLLEGLGLKKTIYVSLMDLLPLDKGETISFIDPSIVPTDTLSSHFLLFTENLGLSRLWESFLLSFFERGDVEILLGQLSNLYQETSLTLAELSLHLFSHISAFYFIFSFLSLFSFLFICLLLETIFAPMGKEEEETPILIKIFSATLNVSFTLFFLFMLRQVLSPILEYFTIHLERSLLFEYGGPIFYYFDRWYQQLIL